MDKRTILLENSTWPVMGKQTAPAKKVYWSKDEMMDRVKDCRVDVMIEN